MSNCPKIAFTTVSIGYFTTLQKYTVLENNLQISSVRYVITYVTLVQSYADKPNNIMKQES